MPKKFISDLKDMRDHALGCHHCATHDYEHIAKCQTGSGILDKVREGYKRVKGFFQGPRVGAPPQIRELLASIGDVPINSITVCKEPINLAITLALSLISKGQFAPNVLKRGYDSMFHLWLSLKIGERVIRIEKNEVVMVKDDKSVGTLSLVVKMPATSITLNQLFQKTEAQVGARRLWIYNPTNPADNSGGNCQRFVDDILTALGVNTHDLHKFILQDADVLSGDTASIGKHLTNLAARLDILKNGNGRTG